MPLMRREALFLGVALSILFARPVQASAPSNRDACKAALALEEHGAQTISSRKPCRTALMTNGTPEDMRNEVASLMSPAQHPSLDDLVLGASIADAAIVKAKDQPWGYLARCDVARRLGSADTLETCLQDLRRFAPDHEATRRALAFASEQSSRGIWLLRAFVLLGLLGTLVHALVQLWYRRRAQEPSKLVVGVVLLGTTALLSVFAPRIANAAELPTLKRDHLSSFPIDDEDPESSVPPVEEQNKKPLEFGYFMQDLLAKAEKAGQAGDHAAEARYYSALTKVTPNSAYAPSKLCSAFEAAGNIPKAVAACRTAVTRNGATADDFVHFVNVVLSSHDKLPPLEQQELTMVLDHLAGETKLSTVPAMLRCEVALRFDNTAALEACTNELTKSAPKDPKTVSFQWALALRKHDRSAALKMIDRARGIGMSAEGIAKMEAVTRQMTLRWLTWIALFATGAILVGAIIRFGFARFNNRRQAAV
jgi:hypothetical protein